MEGPTYKLEKVILGEDSLQDFEGPLYLILSLLSKNKIEIKNIQISIITDQYLEYIEKMESMDMEVASEFVAMASHLVYIKTKLLLVPDDIDALSELDKLIKCLEEHKGREKYFIIKKAAEGLAPLWEKGCDMLEKPAETPNAPVDYQYRHEISELQAAMLRVWDRGEIRRIPTAERINDVIPKVPYSVAGKISQLISKFKSGVKVKFKSLFAGSRSRSEIVATFLAILELAAKKQLKTSGAGDEDITYIGGSEDDAG